MDEMLNLGFRVQLKNILEVIPEKRQNLLFSATLDEEVESISQQMERLIAYLHCLPVTLICVDAIEADDVIAKLTQQYEQDEKCKRIHIMSADQDFIQLVTNKTYVYSPSKKKIYNHSLVL
jgi:superfamily II DNA/RNA helicase